MATIQAAAGLATDGDTIIVGPGVYREVISPPAVGTPAQSVLFLADGTGEETGDPPGPVIVDASGLSGVAVLLLSGASDVIVDGFVFTGGADAGIQVRSRSDRVQIRNCEVFGNTSDGIRVQDSNDVFLLNNLVHHNGRRGILVGGSARGGSQRARVIHNTIADNADSGIVIGTADVASRDAFLQNNAIQNNGLAIGQFNIRVSTGPPSSLDGYRAVYNLVFPLANGYRGAPASPTDVHADALFLDGSRGDYRLAQPPLQESTSPAVDAGDPSLDAGVAALVGGRSTRSDGARDVLPPDIGYHVPAAGTERSLSPEVDGVDRQ